MNDAVNNDAGPLTDEEWPASIEDLRAGFAGPLNVYRVMARHPALLRSWATLRNHVVLESTLTPAQREVVILRAAHGWEATYEWKHHVVRGRKAGLDETRIDRCQRDPSEWPAGETDTLLMAAVDALLSDGKLAEPQLGALVAHIGQPGVFDLMATVGMYTTLAFLVKTFETPLEADIAAALLNP